MYGVGKSRRRFTSGVISRPCQPEVWIRFDTVLLCERNDNLGSTFTGPMGIEFRVLVSDLPSILGGSVAFEIGCLGAFFEPNAIRVTAEDEAFSRMS